MKLFIIAISAFLIFITGCEANQKDSVKENNSQVTIGEGGAAASAADNTEDSVSDSDNSEIEDSNEKKSSAENQDKIETIYTDLEASKCRTTDSNEEEGWIVQECPGVAGYKLQVTEGDLRQTINVIAPSGGKYELDFQKNVSYGFSTLGKKAEWRVKKVDGKIQPVALITRFNASENPENPAKNTSYLVVTKFDGEFICITDVVKPVKNANEKARELADVAASKPCLKGNK